MKKNSILAIACMLMISLVLLGMFASPVSASLRSCRTDPVFHFSNGDQLTVILDIGADIASVTKASYTLHVPAGITVTQVDYIPASLASIESYTVVQDNPANKYTSNILVITTGTGKVDVTASAQFNTATAIAASGHAGTSFSVAVSAPTNTSGTSTIGAKK